MNTLTAPAGGAIPAGLPRLARGRHPSPEQGSCLMEYVSVLAGLRFTDHPRCTHPLLGWLARRVNDAVSDIARPRLVTVAPALIGTRQRHRSVRAVIFGEIARAGLAAAPHDRWLADLDVLTRRRLDRLPDPATGPAGEPAATRPRRWAQPLLTVDRNFAFGCLAAVLGPLDPADRDRLLLGLLAVSVHDGRRWLELPTVPAPASTSTAASN